AREPPRNATAACGPRSGPYPPPEYSPPPHPRVSADRRSPVRLVDVADLRRIPARAPASRRADARSNWTVARSAEPAPSTGHGGRIRPLLLLAKASRFDA